VRDGVVGEDLIKLSKREIRSGDRAVSGVVPTRNDLEEQITCLGVDGG
jgi:hypothetical protein